MLPHNCVTEFKHHWLPNITDAGLDRIIEMIEKGSPMLISGCFTRAMPMGCLASHIAWNHPETSRLNLEAGIMWLTRIAHLNPATSAVIREWDRLGPADWQFRAELLELLYAERTARQNREPVPAFCETVTV